jgi:hypothetical protein
MHHNPVQAPDAKGSHQHSWNFQSPLRVPIQSGYLHVHHQEQHRGVQQVCQSELGRSQGTQQKL